MKEALGEAALAGECRVAAPAGLGASLDLPIAGCNARWHRWRGPAPVSLLSGLLVDLAYGSEMTPRTA